jgi:hypothetical protein
VGASSQNGSKEEEKNQRRAINIRLYNSKIDKSNSYVTEVGGKNEVKRTVAADIRH